MPRQTPQQKRANEKFARVNEKHMGRPESSYKKKDVQRSPVGQGIVILLIFVIIVPIVLEFSKVGGGILGMFTDLLARFGLISKR